jgi:hypothetical protein
MKAWFGPLPGTNVGYGGVWVTYNVMPVSWEGWLVTLVYLVVQFGGAVATAMVLSFFGWSIVWLLVQVTVLHLVYLWIASRHYVTRAEMDPSALPADMRGNRPDE